ncbi:hypothetical protein BB560_003360 [Smittium megazygosporum]|uniref:Cytochrome P450 n=1 Tax=Smittium megazygosporum TaxID=133381 RepID=A0A2T9ZC68_9FUNG|nr:hypothetical protein BB560_003360 [Smittium megazygosporum]
MTVVTCFVDFLFWLLLPKIPHKIFVVDLLKILILNAISFFVSDLFSTIVQNLVVPYLNLGSESLHYLSCADAKLYSTEISPNDKQYRVFYKELNTFIDRTETIINIKTGDSSCHLLTNQHVIEYALAPESLLSLSKYVDKNHRKEFNFYTRKLESLIISKAANKSSNVYTILNTLTIFQELEAISGLEKVYGPRREIKRKLANSIISNSKNVPSANPFSKYVSDLFLLWEEKWDLLEVKKVILKQKSLKSNNACQDILSYAIKNVNLEDYSGIDIFAYSLYKFPLLFARMFSKVLHNSTAYIANNEDMYTALNREQNSLMLKYGNRVNKMVLDKMVVLDQFFSLSGVLYFVFGIPRLALDDLVLSNGVTIPKNSETFYFLPSSKKPKTSKEVYIGNNTWINKLDSRSHLNDPNDLCWGLSTMCPAREYAYLHLKLVLASLIRLYYITTKKKLSFTISKSKVIAPVEIKFKLKSAFDLIEN